MKTKKLLILLITVISLFYSCNCKIPGEYVEANAYNMYYMLNSPKDQTFAFGSSKSFFVALTGNFECDSNQDGSMYKLNGIKINPKIISSSGKFKNLKLEARNIDCEQKNDGTTINYSLHRSSNRDTDSVFMLKCMDSISKKDQIKISFQLDTINTDKDILSDIEKWREMTKKKINLSEFRRGKFEIALFAGGGYECDGIGFFGSN